MTTKNSICIKCEHLDAFTGSYVSSKGKKALISTCIYGGKNAGDRKTCKSFQLANEKKISNRLATLEEGESNAG